MVIEVIVASGTLAFIYLRYKIKVMIRNFERNHESEQLVYKLNRNAVICPRCSAGIPVQTFEEQMTDFWECPVCRCVWREYYTHDHIER